MHSLKQIGFLSFSVNFAVLFQSSITLADVDHPIIVDTTQGSGTKDVSPPTLTGGSAQSQELCRQAIQLGRDGQFEESRALLVEALKDDPPLEAYFAFGQVELALGNPCGAHKAYSTFLRLDQGSISERKKARVAAHIRQLEKNGAASPAKCQPETIPGTLTILCDHPAISASIDGDEVDLTENSPISLISGQHEIVFRAGAVPQPTTFVTINPGVASTVQCAPVQQELTQSSDFSPTEKIGISLAGAGLGFSIATLTHFLWNRGRHEAWKRQDNSLSQFTDVELNDGFDAVTEAIADHNSVGDSITNAEGATIGLAIVSGALVATGLTVFVVGKQKKKPPSNPLSAAISPGSAVLTWKGQW